MATPICLSYNPQFSPPLFRCPFPPSPILFPKFYPSYCPVTQPPSTLIGRWNSYRQAFTPTPSKPSPLWAHRDPPRKLSLLPFFPLYSCFHHSFSLITLRPFWLPQFFIDHSSLHLNCAKLYPSSLPPCNTCPRSLCPLAALKELSRYQVDSNPLKTPFLSLLFSPALLPCPSPQTVLLQVTHSFFRKKMLFGPLLFFSLPLSHLSFPLPPFFFSRDLKMASISLFQEYTPFFLPAQVGPFP